MEQLIKNFSKVAASYVVLCFFFSSLLTAQTESYQLGGYAKYLYSNTDNPSIGRVNDHFFHSRINSKFFLAEGMTIGAELRNRIVFGGSVEKNSNFLSTIRAQHEFENVDIVWWNNSSSVGYSELDRLWCDASYNKFQITLGRQRIAWGTAMVWNPTDLFNPLSILDFDYEERPGVDALRVQYFSSEVSKIEIAVKPGKTKSGSVVAAKLLLNAWKYDFHLLGGARAQEPFLGIGWAGDIEGAGFRGEMLTSKIGNDVAAIFPQFKNQWSTSGTLSADYTFPNNLYLHTELLYNTRGVTNNTLAALPLAQSLHLLSPARWSVFQEVSFDVHPIVRVSGFVIHNPNDGSSVLVPSLSWSALENFDVMCIGLFFTGDAFTEYGTYGQSVFMRMKYSF